MPPPQLGMREEECLVFLLVIEVRNEDRPADTAAEDVLLQNRDGRLEEVSGIECIVAQEIVGVGVELLRARLGSNFDLSAAGNSVLRAVVVFQNSEFSN